MSFYFIIAAILLCVMLEMLYSGGEVALFASDINKLKNRAHQGSKAAEKAVELKEKPEWFISTALVGTNLAIIIASTLATGLLISFYGGDRGEKIAFLVTIPTLFLMIIARSVFLYYAETMAVRVAWFIRFSSMLFYPVAFVIAAVSRGTVHLSSDRKAGETSHITKEGLKYILGEKTKGGDILTREKEMVSRVFDFSELTAVKIMVPISALTSLPASMKISEAVGVVADKKYMRIPVYENTVYNIVGILHYFDLLEMLLKDKQKGESVGEATVASCMRKDVFYVPETKKVSELLVAMQKKDEQMAVVVDEYGGATGVVTIEDIGEEIVGTIDEYVAGEKLYRQIVPGRYLVSGRLEMGTLRQLIKINLPEGNYETVGGFLMQQMGRIPKPKERYQYGDVTFIIENADQKSIKEVMVNAPYIQEMNK
ncbi:MAG TPA: hemolysin family protein [Smithella sp.]|nr:HlyC/CorC family transporter [Smithella sp.]MDM7988679.1 hemolysin family protein [Smithella sp.]HNY49376.1 hemolysin family protein [Smithella sp.]HOG89433.1 hemolysin family protein [Smithella sp.]HOU50204.1 hemolysin family protein [Smithella sp.]